MEKQGEKELLMKMWHDAKNCREKEVKVNLEHDYRRNESRKGKMITEALSFWGFIQDNLSDEDWEIRRCFLAEFLSDKNHLVSLVARIERLPTTVWRALLWEGNLDFMSAEAFLRRVTHEQRSLVKKNHNEFFEGKIPSILTGRKCFRNITADQLFSEDLNYEKRYANKAAMVTNLFDLDMGFNAYPNGVNDDTRLTSASIGKFLSIKNHSDDFVVNQEHGQYWKMYRSARSNYVYLPNLHVTLKRAICPGFWYTMAMHLLFWILSPFAFVGLGAKLALSGLPESLPIYVCVALALLAMAGFFTPMWLLAALIKFAYTKIFNHQRRERIRNWCERHKKKFTIVLYICSACSVLSFAWIIFWIIADKIHFLVALWVPATLCWLVYLFYTRIKYEMEPEDYSGRFWVTGYFLSLVLLEMFVCELFDVIGLIVEIVLSFIYVVIRFPLEGLIWLAVQIFGYIVPLVQILFVFWFCFTIPLVVVIATNWLFSRLSEKTREKIYILWERLIFGLILVLIASLIIVMATTDYRAELIETEHVFGFIVFIGLYFFLLYYLLKRIGSYDPILETFESAMKVVRSEHRGSGFCSFNYRIFQHNKWFRSLSKEDQAEVFWRVWLANRKIFSSHYAEETLNRLSKILNWDVLSQIESFSQEDNDWGYTIGDRKSIFWLMMKGRSNPEAVAMTKKRNARVATIKKVSIIGLKVIFCYLWISFLVLRKVVKLIGHSKQLIAAFNKMCPFTVVPREVKI